MSLDICNEAYTITVGASAVEVRADIEATEVHVVRVGAGVGR